MSRRPREALGLRTTAWQMGRACLRHPAWDAPEPRVPRGGEQCPHLAVARWAQRASTPARSDAPEGVAGAPLTEPTPAIHRPGLQGSRVLRASARSPVHVGPIPEATKPPRELQACWVATAFERPEQSTPLAQPTGRHARQTAFGVQAERPPAAAPAQSCWRTMWRGPSTLRSARLASNAAAMPTSPEQSPRAHRCLPRSR